jgi:hypothetical protein
MALWRAREVGAHQDAPDNSDHQRSSADDHHR